MSRFSGPAYKGAARDMKAVRRGEAAERDRAFHERVAAYANNHRITYDEARGLLRRRPIDLGRSAVTQ